MTGEGVITEAQVGAFHPPNVAPFLTVLIAVDAGSRRFTPVAPLFFGDIGACVAATRHLFTPTQLDQGFTLGELVGRRVTFDYAGEGQSCFDLASMKVLP